GRWLGPELGTFAGAFAVGLGSNLYARWLDKPEAITEVPGILILVPGSIGFRGITAMLDNEVVSGVETGFRVLLIASSLVAGLLIANLVMPKARRI
ncbi:MAG TPA: threonine/serine exporter family protein, partial [Gemmatimonadales bacterium]